MEKLMTADQTQEKIAAVPGWKLFNNGRGICREYEMKDFAAAVALIGRIAAVAEEEGHHPDLHLTDYRLLRVELTTHSAGGLSEKDFTEAARINALPADLKR